MYLFDNYGYLVPDDDKLFDSAKSQEEFVDLGEGFVSNALISRCGLKNTDNVLDLGSGNGQKARPLVRYLSPSAAYCGFDASEEAVRWCRGRYARHRNFNFSHADVHSKRYNAKSNKSAIEYRFPYINNFFDVAFASSLFPHLQPEETRRYLSETARVLKPGGRLFMTCFLITRENRGRHHHSFQGNQFAKASDTHWLLDPVTPSGGVAYEEQALRQMIVESGLTTSEVYFGRWSQATDVLGLFQDAMIIKRPE